MKRLVSMLVVVSMLLCMPVGFADAFAELYDLTYKAQQSSIMSCDISFKLDNTLDFLEAFEIPYMEFVDAYHLTKGIFDTSSTINAQIISSESYDKIDAYMEFILDVPVQINEDFKVTVWNRFSMWMKMDISDEENPVISYVMKIPYDDKYLVYDLESLNVAEAEVMLAQMDLDKLMEQSKALLKKYSVVEKTAHGYVMTISKENCNSYIMEVFKMAGQSYTDENIKALYDETMAEFENYVTETGIFGDGGIVAEYKVENNSIVSADETVSVSLTIPFENPETYEETMETIEFSVVTTYSYTTPEKGFTIEFPEITEENSTVIGSEAEEDYTYVPRDYFYISYDGLGYYTETDRYVPLNYLMAELQVVYENIVYEGNNITITSEDEYTGFKTLTLSLDSSAVTKDGEQFDVPNGVVKYNDATWISENFLNQVLGIEVSYFEYSYGDSADEVITDVSLNREEIYSDSNDYYYDDDGYISPDVWIYSENSVLKRDTHYFEFNDLMKCCGATEVEVLGNTETAVSVDSAIPYSEITILGGSNIVTADDTTIKLDDIILRLGGKLYVPAEYIYNVLGFKIRYVSEDGYYSLTYPNPDFVYEELKVFWVSEYDLPYFDGEVFIPLEAFEIHSAMDVDDNAPIVEHNGKKYITQGYINDNFGFKLFGLYSNYDAEQNGFYTEYSFEKAE